MILASLILSLWSWTVDDTADGSLFCWSYDPTLWIVEQCHDTGADTFFDDTGMDRLWGFDEPGVTKIVYICAAAYNEAGVSDVCRDGNAFDPTPFTPFDGVLP